MYVFPSIKWLQAMVINISVNSFVVAHTSFGLFSFRKPELQPQFRAFGSIEKTINFWYLLRNGVLTSYWPFEHIWGF